MTDAQKQTLAAFIATGRHAFHYPRKKRISIDGNKLLTIDDAMRAMRAYIAKAPKS